MVYSKRLIDLLFLVVIAVGTPFLIVVLIPGILDHGIVVVVHNIFPPLPTTIATPLAPVPIIMVAPMVDDSVSVVGVFDSKGWTVRISTGLSPLQQWLTFYHERYHILVWESQVELDSDTEDILAELYAHDQVWLMQHPIR